MAYGSTVQPVGSLLKSIQALIHQLVDAELRQASFDLALSARDEHPSIVFLRFFHHAFDREACRDAEVWHIGDVEQQDSVLPHQHHPFTDPLRSTETQRPVQVEQDQVVAAALQELLFLRGQVSRAGIHAA